MIRLSETKTLDNYFIDENAVITDKKGNIQKQYLSNGRYCFKQQYVHKIMMNTFYGWRDSNWVVHHLDENKLNNSLSNLIYLTRKEHSILHNKGEKNHNYGKHFSKEIKRKMSIAKRNMSEETKEKIRNAHLGKYWKLSNETKEKIRNANLGKSLSNETKTRMRDAKIGLKWWNNGIKNIKAKECPNGFVAGIFKNK